MVEHIIEFSARNRFLVFLLVFSTFAGYLNNLYDRHPLIHAARFTVLGGIAGGIIGHNNGRKTAEGVAIGAASGAVLGVIADQSLQNRSSTYSSAPVSARTVPWGTEPVRYQHSHGTPAIIATPAVVTTPIASGYIPPTPTASAPIQAQTVIINNYYGSGPMAPANSLFGR